MKTIRRHDTIVGHLPRQISTICHLFLRNGGIITCTVSGRRQCSTDLPQGDLEVPCQLVLISSDKKLLDKTMLLLQKAPPVTISNSTTVTGVVAADTPVSDSKLESIPIHIADVEETATDSINKGLVWIHIEKCTMLQSDKQCLLTPGYMLNDKHINTTQALLEKQFTNVSGLQSILFQYKMLPERMTNGLQVIYCNGCHWVTAYKEDPSTHTIRICDWASEKGPSRHIKFDHFFQLC